MKNLKSLSLLAITTAMIAAGCSGGSSSEEKAEKAANAKAGPVDPSLAPDSLSSQGTPAARGGRADASSFN